MTDDTKRPRVLLNLDGGEHDDEPEELYALARDPAEKHNLADEEPERLAQARTLLATLRASSAELRTAHAATAVGPEERAALASLGYLSGSGAHQTTATAGADPP